MTTTSPDSINSPDYKAVYGKTALVDGDTFVYRCAAVAEKTHYLAHNGMDRTIAQEFDNHRDAKKFSEESPYGTIIWSRKEVQPVENALQATKFAMEALLEKIKPSDIKVFISGHNNFRYEIAKTNPYKARRAERPRYYGDVRDYLTSKYAATTTDGIEADDSIGIHLTRLGDKGIAVTNDKDLDQIPGWHFNWVTNELYRVSPKDGAFALYSQILSGDATDTVVGIPGIGPSKAAKLLEGARNTSDLYQRTWSAYQSHAGEIGLEGQDLYDYFIEQANLVYILKEVGERYKPPVT